MNVTVYGTKNHHSLVTEKRLIYSSYSDIYNYLLSLVSRIEAHDAQRKEKTNKTLKNCAMQPKPFLFNSLLFYSTGCFYSTGLFFWCRNGKIEPKI